MHSLAELVGWYGFCAARYDALFEGRLLNTTMQKKRHVFIKMMEFGQTLKTSYEAHTRYGFINSRMSEVVRWHACSKIMQNRHNLEGNPPSSKAIKFIINRVLSQPKCQAFDQAPCKLPPHISVFGAFPWPWHGMAAKRSIEKFQDSDTPRWWKQCSPQDRVW